MYRAIHSVRKLRRSWLLNRQAKRYARKLAKNGFYNVRHDPQITPGVGENIFAYCGSDVSGSDVTTAW